MLCQNIIHGDALAVGSRAEDCKACKPASDQQPGVPVRQHTCQPIIFAEWAYLGKGKFQRRDFRLDNLTIFGGDDLLFIQNGKHEIFKPVKTYPPVTASELATLVPEVIV